MPSPTSSVSTLPEEVAIRPLTTADIPKIKHIHTRTLTTPYSPPFYRQLLIHSDRLCLIAHPVSSPNTPVAFVSACISTQSHDLSAAAPTKPQVHILTLGVLPEYRRNGIARRLLQTAVRALRDAQGIHPSELTTVSAHVSVLNENGKRFYTSIGLHGREVLHNAYRSRHIPQNARDALVVVGTI